MKKAIQTKNRLYSFYSWKPFYIPSILIQLYRGSSFENFFTRPMDRFEYPKGTSSLHVFCIFLQVNIYRYSVLFLNFGGSLRAPTTLFLQKIALSTNTEGGFKTPKDLKWMNFWVDFGAEDAGRLLAFQGRQAKRYRKFAVWDVFGVGC